MIEEIDFSSENGQVVKVIGLIKSILRMRDRMGTLLPIDEIGDWSDLPKEELDEYLNFLVRKGFLFEIKEGYYRIVEGWFLRETLITPANLDIACRENK